MLEEFYTSGDYIEKHPTWHVEDSPWKAKQVIRMMERNHIAPKTICEVGCGAGEILKQLQAHMREDCLFWGYDISPQAFELSQRRANERLHFKLADIRQEKKVFFDLILLMDVIEHMEDYFSFLREIKPKSSYQILHIPLDLTIMGALSAGRLRELWKSYGHIHHFNKDIALQMLTDVGYEVLDHFYTPWAIDFPTATVNFKSKLLKIPRKLFFAIRKDLAVRALGGWSLLVLTK